MGIKINPDLSLRDDLQHQLSIAPELEEFVATTMTGRQEFTIDERRACIVMALASKSFMTFRSIFILLKTSSPLPEDAAALVRILYESTLTATFLLHADSKIVDDYADFFMYRNWRDHQLVRELDATVADKALSPDLLQEMERQFTSVQSRYSNGKWTALSAEAMAKAADKDLPDGFKVFGLLYASIYRRCSAYVHSDVRSIQSQIQQEALYGVVRIEHHSSERHCGQLMYAANFLMLTICFVASVTFFGTKHIDKWNSVVKKWNGDSVWSVKTEVPPLQ